MSIIRTLCFVLASLSLAALAEAPKNEGVALTEQQAIALFFQRNLALIAASYNVDQARAEEIIASAIPNPVFSLSVNELSNQMSKAANSKALPGINPQIQQLIETAGKRGLRMESAGLGAEATEYDVQNVTRVLTNAVRHAFYGLLLAQPKRRWSTAPTFAPPRSVSARPRKTWSWRGGWRFPM